MNKLKELLVGYCDPNVLAISERPIGQTGLTQRLALLAQLWEISASMRKQHFWRFGNVHFPDSFRALVGMADMNWLTEMLRILDRARSNRRGVAVENLTIELCHERFQGEPTITTVRKIEEARLYKAIEVIYNATGLREIRNLHMFHLDLMAMLASPKRTSDIRELTKSIIGWYTYVGSLAYNAEPVFVTQAHRTGKRIAREFRLAFTARLREIVGKPRRKKARFSSPA